MVNLNETDRSYWSWWSASASTGCMIFVRCAWSLNQVPVAHPDLERVETSFGLTVSLAPGTSPSGFLFRWIAWAVTGTELQLRREAPAETSDSSILQNKFVPFERGTQNSGTIRVRCEISFSFTSWPDCIDVHLKTWFSLKKILFPPLLKCGR